SEWIAMSNEQRQTIVESKPKTALALNAPVQNASAVSSDTHPYWPMLMFEPKRGFLTKKTRDSLCKIMAKISPLHYSIVQRLAKDFLSGRPLERWFKPIDVLRYGKSDSHEDPKLYLLDGDTCTVLEMPKQAELVKVRGRQIVADLRERKAQREAALLQCLAAMLPDSQ